jgi:hypothetical protein
MKWFERIAPSRRAYFLWQSMIQTLFTVFTTLKIQFSHSLASFYVRVQSLGDTNIIFASACAVEEVLDKYGAVNGESSAAIHGH